MPGSVQENRVKEIQEEMHLPEWTVQASRIENISSIQQNSMIANFTRHVEDPRLDSADQISVSSFLVDLDAELQRKRVDNLHVLEVSPNVYQEHGMLETINLGLHRNQYFFTSMQEFTDGFVNKLNKMQRKDITIVRHDRKSTTIVK